MSGSRTARNLSLGHSRHLASMLEDRTPARRVVAAILEAKALVDDGVLTSDPDRLRRAGYEIPGPGQNATKTLTTGFGDNHMSITVSRGGYHVELHGTLDIVFTGFRSRNVVSLNLRVPGGVRFRGLSLVAAVQAGLRRHGMRLLRSSGNREF